MIGWFLNFTRQLLGGGSSYLIMALCFIITAQYLQVRHLKAETQKLEIIKDDAISKVRERDTLILSQNNQFDRIQRNQEAQTHAEGIIQAVPDSENCRDSRPVGRAIEWLREHRYGAANTGHD